MRSTRFAELANDRSGSIHRLGYCDGVLGTRCTIIGTVRRNSTVRRVKCETQSSFAFGHTWSPYSPIPSLYISSWVSNLHTLDSLTLKFFASTTMSSPITLPAGFAFTRAVHNAPYLAIAPTRPELSQAGKTVLITGGHTGIGYAIARAFAQASAERVIIIGRRDNLVASAASRLTSEFPSTQTLGRICDVADGMSVDRLWKDLANENIFIDVVVLNAAKLSARPILDLGRDAIWEEYIINVRTHLDFIERIYKQRGAKGRQKVSVGHDTLSHKVVLTRVFRQSLI